MLRCFIDLDGVITDFVGAVCNEFGVPVSSLYVGWPPGDWGIYNGFGITEDQLWERIDKAGRVFWTSMKPTPDGYDILTECERAFGSENIAILTSPPRNPLAVAGKVEWIREHLPAYRRRFFVGPAKEMLAHAGAVLVDDSDKNAAGFISGGGRVVLVPRRWNSLYSKADDALWYVRQLLQTVKHAAEYEKRERV